MPPSAWSRQSFNFALFFFGYFGFVGVFAPYASLYFAEKGMTVAQIGILMSLMQVMRIFGPNLWGWVADHSRQRVSVLRYTALAAVISFCGLFFGQTFAYYFAVMVLLNLFVSAQAPLSDAMVLSSLKGDLTHYGKLRLWGSVGFIVAVAGAGPAMDWQGVGLMPWISLAMLGLTLLASWGVKEPEKSGVAHAVPSAVGFLRRREVAAFFVSTFMMIAAHAALYVFYSLHLEQIGYSKSLIGLMWSVGVLCEIAFFFYQAPIFRRFGVRNLMLASLALAVVRFLMIGFGAESVMVLLVAQVLHAATFGVHHSASIATLQRWFAGPLQARGQALFISISYGMGGTAGGLIMSACWERFGAQAVYIAAATFALCGTVAAACSYHWQLQYKKGNDNHDKSILA